MATDLKGCYMNSQLKLLQRVETLSDDIKCLHNTFFKVFVSFYLPFFLAFKNFVCPNFVSPSYERYGAFFQQLLVPLKCYVSAYKTLCHVSSSPRRHAGAAAIRRRFFLRRAATVLRELFLQFFKRPLLIKMMKTLIKRQRHGTRKIDGESPPRRHGIGNQYQELKFCKTGLLGIYYSGNNWEYTIPKS